MSLAAPWALLGLLALPVIWWIQRHRRKAAVVELPTLMFLLEEDERVHQPRKRGLDLETVLALTAAALLALAAAGPAIERGAPITRVRVVVAGGGPAHAAGYVDRARGVIDAIRGAGAEVDVVWLPAQEPATRFDARPDVDALLGAARAGAASVRVIVADRLPDDAPGDVRWVGIGDTGAVNLGIVGARIVGPGDAPALFLTLARDPAPAAPLSTTLSVDGQSTPVEIDTQGYGVARVPLPEGVGQRRWTVRLGSGPDALAADDEVVLELVPLGVTLDPALSPGVRAALERALDAVVGREARVDDAALRIGPGRAPDVELGVGSLAADGAATTAPRGTPLRQPDPLVADLDPAGVTWIYAAGDEVVEDGERVLLGIRADDRTWPIVTRRADGRVRFAPDPSRGDPPPAAAPLWPLFIENWITSRGRFGVTPRGLLDPDVSRLGRADAPFDPDWVSAAAPTVPAPRVPLRTPLLAIALLVLGVLWAVPLVRRRVAVPAP
ncbi:MAG: BatA domain-containing protein [Planctomycetota bacterium]|nr:BatA domain-containing protein [Planctomycetota bacterium]